MRRPAPPLRGSGTRARAYLGADPVAADARVVEQQARRLPENLAGQRGGVSGLAAEPRGGRGEPQAEGADLESLNLVDGSPCRIDVGELKQRRAVALACWGKGGEVSVVSVTGLGSRRSVEAEAEAACG